MAILALTQEQWWWVQNLVRRTDHQGEPWDRDDMAAVHKAIVSLVDAYPDKQAALEVSTGFLWQIENQVPQSLDLGRSNMGRKILIEVFRALHHEEGAEYVTAIPDVFRDANTHEDDTGTDDSAGAKAEPRGDLRTAEEGTTGTG